MSTMYGTSLKVLFDKDNTKQQSLHKSTIDTSIVRRITTSNKEQKFAKSHGSILSVTTCFIVAHAWAANFVQLSAKIELLTNCVISV